VELRALNAPMRMGEGEAACSVRFRASLFPSPRFENLKPEEQDYSCACSTRGSVVLLFCGL